MKEQNPYRVIASSERIQFFINSLNEICGPKMTFYSDDNHFKNEEHKDENTEQVNKYMESNRNKSMYLKLNAPYEELSEQEKAFYDFYESIIDSKEFHELLENRSGHLFLEDYDYGTDSSHLMHWKGDKRKDKDMYYDGNPREHEGESIGRFGSQTMFNIRELWRYSKVDDNLPLKVGHLIHFSILNSAVKDHTSYSKLYKTTGIDLDRFRQRKTPNNAIWSGVDHITMLKYKIGKNKYKTKFKTGEYGWKRGKNFKLIHKTNGKKERQLLK